MKEGLIKEIIAHGDRATIVSISRFEELKSELEYLRSNRITA
jgi:hypothetical protein